MGSNYRQRTTDYGTAGEHADGVDDAKTAREEQDTDRCGDGQNERQTRGP
jgi:hypothetical protein